MGEPTTAHTRNVGPVRSYIPRFHAKIPILTAVCRESRAVAFMFYTLAFGSPISPPRVWFSFERDTLHMPEHVIAGFERGHYSANDLGPDFAKVKHLSLADSYLEDIRLDEEGTRRHEVPHCWCSKTISWFSSLQSLTYTIIPSYELRLPGGDLILVEVQDAAAALDCWDEIEFDMSCWPGQWFTRKRESTKPFPEGWERSVVQALNSRLEERAHLEDFRGAILPDMDSLKIFRKALSTTQDPDMMLRFNRVMKELAEFEREAGF